MKIYGWEELGECCYGISTEIVEACNVTEVIGDDEEDGLLEVLNEWDREMEGWWYRTFSQAKKAQIAALKFDLEWRKQAIATIRSQKKNDTF